MVKEHGEFRVSQEGMKIIIRDAADAIMMEDTLAQPTILSDKELLVYLSRYCRRRLFLEGKGIH